MTKTKQSTYIISEGSKLVQREYNTRHNWLGKVIHWKLCKKFKFDHMSKWYMYNPEYILENKMHKILCDFEIQMDYLKKRIFQIVNFTILTNHRIKLKKNKKRDKYLDLT